MSNTSTDDSFTTAEVEEALQCAWNEYCDDTGCYPDCFKVEIGPAGRKRLTADFLIAPFASIVAGWLGAARASPEGAT